MVDVLLANAQVRRRNDQLRMERRFADRSNPLESLTPAEVKRTYRFLPATVYFITEILLGDLLSATERSNPLPPLLQVLCTSVTFLPIV